MAGLSRYEQETIINFNEDDAQAELYTASPRMMRKWAKLAEREPEKIRMVRRDEYSVTYTCPREWLYNAVRIPRTFSDAQRAALNRARTASMAARVANPAHAEKNGTAGAR